MEYPKSFIIFDTETTGLDNKKEKVIEIGAIKVVDGKIISTFEALLEHNLEEDRYIPEINGITYQEIKEKGIEAEKVFEEFIGFLDGKPLIGHNILRFDIPFLAANHPNFRLLVLDDVIDTAALYKAYKLGLSPRKGQSQYDFMNNILHQRHYGVKYSIDACCSEFNINKSLVKQHRAIGDCHLTKAIYDNLCRLQNNTEKILV